MSMTICEDRHEQIIYTKWDRLNRRLPCPLCKALGVIAEMEEDIKNLEKEMKEEVGV
jgi:hypothetical protein